MRFEEFVKIVEKNKWEFYGIEVFRKGELIHQYGDCTEHRYPIYSATKTFTSTAAGIAVDEGKFSIQESIYEYLKAEIPAYVGQEQIDNLKKITIERLLTMSVQGYPFRPEGQDWMGFSLAYRPETVEIPKFRYSNIPAYLVGAAVEKAVGEHLISYLLPRLFAPLGIEDPVYGNCPGGHFYGASAMELTVDELRRLGQMYLQNGSYMGKQIVSEKWIRMASACHISNQEGGYGYFLWRCPNGYRISGKWGQCCWVFPEKNLVIAYLSHMEENSKCLSNTVAEYLLVDEG